MPELPEVETIARGVDARLRGDRIEGSWFSGKREPFKTPATVMARALPGKKINRVFRVGKHIVFDLSGGDLSAGDLRGGDLSTGLAPGLRGKGSQSNGSRTPGSRGKATKTRRAAGAGQSLQWIVHLGMTGRLLVAEPETPLPKHTHAILRLASGRELRFVDPRRFGRMSLHTESSVEQGFQGSGREPLEVSAAEFSALFHKRRTSIKAALLNQRILHGVGNIYADESLFRAGIRPRRMASGLSRAELDRLHRSLKQVLREAISLGGSSVSDYVDASGSPGFFQLEHKVYMRTGQPCAVCESPIRRVVVAGRGTHYCPLCQS